MCRTFDAGVSQVTSQSSEGTAPDKWGRQGRYAANTVAGPPTVASHPQSPIRQNGRAATLRVMVERPRSAPRGNIAAVAH